MRNLDARNPEHIGTPEPEQKKDVYVIWKGGPFRLMSDGSIVDIGADAHARQKKAEESERRGWEVENEADSSELLDEFREKYPIGGTIDMQAHLSQIFGSFETIQKLKRLQDDYNDICDRGDLLYRQRDQGGDVNKEIIEHHSAVLENRMARAKFLDKQGLNITDGLNIGDEALNVLKKHPDGNILHASMGVASLPFFDWDKVELLTKHDDTVLLYIANNEELIDRGGGVNYEIYSVKEYVRLCEERKARRQAFVEKLESLKART